jgi:hypothetical protein
LCERQNSNSASVFKFNQKLLQDHTPILDRHGPFFSIWPMARYMAILADWSFGKIDFVE